MSYELEMLCAYMLGALSPFVIFLGLKAVKTISWPGSTRSRVEDISRRVDSMDSNLIQWLQRIEAEVRTRR